ncbi:3044_t:CDS:2 [Funneliformis geosporum]|uniref:3044_t:CDS:1 n=1 Tax=Funneliformis geosporum TaxID=1117311 RepID=A0A9W4X3J6_9GLOM|nr:3044_t:CDS:2 [Funneliformis geosporum]
MSEEVHELTSAGRIKRPAYNKVAQLVKVAWIALMLKKSKNPSNAVVFISVAKDGTEDDFIFDYDFLNDENNNLGDDVVFEDTIYDDFVAVPEYLHGGLTFTIYSIWNTLHSKPLQKEGHYTQRVL